MDCKLRKIRLNRGFSQYELARRSGVAQSTICDIENGMKSPTVRTLAKLAAALAVPVTTLFEDVQ